jgi:hypothetical protein
MLKSLRNIYTQDYSPCSDSPGQAHNQHYDTDHRKYDPPVFDLDEHEMVTSRLEDIISSDVINDCSLSMSGSVTLKLSMGLRLFASDQVPPLFNTNQLHFTGF